ncbi:hypothetical protein AURDEDRAFT_164463 [Auricularia subglabra TFB-10046 SS5]|nr:hypothetical protein AURDEDRAFT_164463 [Auricularia subglabra TFB-10046 SS5]
MTDPALLIIVLVALVVMSNVGMKAAKMWSLATNFTFAAINTLSTVLSVLGLLSIVVLQFYGSLCAVPLVSAIIRCPIPMPSLQSRSAGPRTSPILADPVASCNIFGTHIAPLSNGMSGYMPTLTLTGNLANNLSLWVPLSAHHHHTLSTLKMLLPRLDEAASGLSDVLSQSERTFELAETTLSFWEQRVVAASTPTTVASIFSRVLGPTDFNQPALTHLPVDVLAGLDSSLQLLTKTTDDLLESVNTQKDIIADLHDAYAATAQAAWEEEFMTSDGMRRRWLPPSSSESAQLELRRAVRFHSISATCALEFVLDALRGISSVLRTMRPVPAHPGTVSVIELQIALRTSRLRAAALLDAITRLEAVLAK